MSLGLRQNAMLWQSSELHGHSFKAPSSSWGAAVLGMQAALVGLQMGACIALQSTRAAAQVQEIILMYCMFSGFFQPREAQGCGTGTPLLHPWSVISDNTWDSMGGGFQPGFQLEAFLCV